MKKLVDILLGYFNITVVCGYPERFLNICAQNGVELWDIVRVDANTVSASCSIKDYRLLRKILNKDDFKISTKRKSGIPFVLFRIKKRYVLIGAMIVTLLLVWTSSLFVWEIRVSGNHSVSTSEILYALDKLGVKVGAFRLTFSQEDISNSILLEIPELSYITVNTNGSIAYVIVREREPAPEMRDKDTPTLVYASKAGIINKMTVLEGRNLKNEGDSVLPGEVIVTGEMESISSQYRYVHAKAEVYARTWYDISAKSSKEVIEKSYTGREKTKTAIVLGNNRVNLYFNSGISYENYDKITKESPLTLFGCIVLPITVITETYSEYEPVKTEKTADEMAGEMEKYLTELLNSEMTGGAIMSYETESFDGNGDMMLTLKAECTEQIGVEREMTPDEIKSQPQGEGET